MHPLPFVLPPRLGICAFIQSFRLLIRQRGIGLDVLGQMNLAAELVVITSPSLFLIVYPCQYLPG